jgi:hydroxyacylglutathione hydrolase
MSTDPLGWLSARPVADGTWAIGDCGCDTMYLLAGAERCLVVDTGYGIGDLPAFVRTLCPLPQVVVNTHGHPDHVLGNWQFPSVYIAAADVPIARASFAPEVRSARLDKLAADGLPDGFDRERWAAREPTLVPVADGHVFDLGGRAVEVVATPGHTPGGVCLLDVQTRSLLTGDSLVGGPTWMHLPTSTDLATYLASLRRLQGLADRFDWLLPGHETPPNHLRGPLPKRLVDEAAEGVAAVIDGRLVGQPERTFAGDGLRCDFGQCGLVYRPDRL